MNIALLTAAGSGTRMGQDIPKQFIHVENKPIIIYTLEAFQNHPGIDKIIVVTLEAWIDVLHAYAQQFNITKLEWIIPGGNTGQESIYMGLQEISKHVSENDTVLIHDGNRPLISSEIISDSLVTLKKYGSAVAAIPCMEAVFKSEDSISSVISIPRESLLRTQTPHTYYLKDILLAHKQALKENIQNTAASCVLMQRLGKQVFFSKGSEQNIKITTTEDIPLFQALLHCHLDSWFKSNG
ncbi:2-C-methyl-D-erythritol 4-phosphate cytidylyltransferase [Clostridiaceae bacterium]|nr:2-C-methyl-D-erythritol 4-phosphate cytidylyltransferase [Clostridiaceae bacterium]